MNLTRSVWMMLGVGLLCSCSAADVTSKPSPDGTGLGGIGTPVPFGTYQAEVELTAEWVQTFTVTQTAVVPDSTSTPEEFQFLLSYRQGDCIETSDVGVHVRQGFCLAAPSNWIVSNVDGGLAAKLNTTPGQSISLQPDWASDPAQCYMLIYVAVESSARNHLETRYREYQTRDDLEALSDIAIARLGSLEIPGFTWNDKTGASGGVYAGNIAANKLLHLSEGGTNCPLDLLLPTIETLRFN